MPAAERGRLRNRPASRTDDVLYVTRRFPPSVGGMQLLARQIHEALTRHGHSELVALGRSQKHLVWFLPLAVVRTAALLVRRRVHYVVCGDVLVHAALYPVLRLFRPTVAVVAHGLDLTFDVKLYRWWVRRTLPRADRVVAISTATAREAERVGVPTHRIHIQPPGLPVQSGDEEHRRAARERIRSRLGLPGGSFVLVTVGRLVKRKGVRWFVEHVLPRLAPEVVYVVVGTGPEHDAIAEAAGDAGSRVRLLGQVDEELRDSLLLAADLFVMPNIAVPGDMEGFGLVAVEATFRGTPVVASRLEGIADAVIDGETGWLCPSGDADAFVARIDETMRDRVALRRCADSFREAAIERYSEERFGEALLHALGLDEPARHAGS